MFYFSTQQRLQALVWLLFFHIMIICSSNYLVQFPLILFGFYSTWGTFTFPFIFLATDLTVRIFGASLARRIIMAVMLPALMISYLMSALFFHGHWQGIAALAMVNIMAARIAVASFMAYILGQLLDIQVFNRLRQLAAWWIAPACSMIIGNISDTFAFFFIAFHNSSDPFMAANWPQIALLDYAFKTLVCLIFFLPAYGILLNMVLKFLPQRKQKSSYSHSGTGVNRP